MPSKVKRRLVVVAETPLTVRDERRFGFSIWRRHGYAITVLDLSPIYFPQRSSSQVELHESEQRQVRSVRKLRKEITELSAGDAVLIMGQIGCPTSTQMRVIRTILLSKAAVFGFLGSPVPAPNLPQGIPTLGSRIGSRLRRAKALVWDLGVLESADSVPRALDCLWTAVPAQTNHAKLVDPDITTVRAIHSLDYDQHLAFRTSNRFQDSTASLVVLDSMGPLHPDFAWEGSHPPCSPEVYHSRVERILAHLEQSLSMSVRILGHPRSSSSLSRQIYGNRDVAFGSTYEQVATSSGVVILEATTSINFPVVLQKPLLLIDTGVMGQYATQFLRACGELLQIPVLKGELDNETVRGAFKTPANHAAYKDRYIKASGTEDNFFWEIAVRDAETVFQTADDFN